MDIQNTGIKRRPTHPGEMLREDYLVDFSLTVSGLAKAVGVSRQSINELLRERRAVSPEMALRLARLFGNSRRLTLTMVVGPTAATSHLMVFSGASATKRRTRSNPRPIPS